MSVSPVFGLTRLGEVEPRGAVRLQRPARITRPLDQRPGGRGSPPSPQRQVLDAVSLGEALLALGETTPALADLTRVVPTAAEAHLPSSSPASLRPSPNTRMTAARELAAHAPSEPGGAQPVAVTPP